MIPHKAPLLYSPIRLKLPGLSKYNKTSTIAPVNGITATRPANVGSLRPISEQKTMTHRLINSLKKNRILNARLIQFPDKSPCNYNLSPIANPKIKSIIISLYFSLSISTSPRQSRTRIDSLFIAILLVWDKNGIYCQKSRGWKRLKSSG